MWQYGRGLSFVTWQPPKRDESDPVPTLQEPPRQGRVHDKRHASQSCMLTSLIRRSQGRLPGREGHWSRILTDAAGEGILGRGHSRAEARRCGRTWFG